MICCSLFGLLLSLVLLALPLTAHCESPAVDVPPRATPQSMEYSLRSQDVLIRFEIRGGILPPEATELPIWSLYGDGLVIWTQEGKPTPGFTRQVWTGHLTPDEMLQLMSLVETIDFWKLDPYYQPAHQVRPDGQIVHLDPAAAPDQPASILTVHATAGRKQVTIYPAHWQGAPDAFRALRDRLLEIRPKGAQEFQPQTFRLEGRSLPSAPPPREQGIPWPFQALDLTRAQSGVLPLTREEGLAVAAFLTDHPPIVRQANQAFSLRLFAAPPREP